MPTQTPEFWNVRNEVSFFCLTSTHLSPLKLLPAATLGRADRPVRPRAELAVDRARPRVAHARRKRRARTRGRRRGGVGRGRLDLHIARPALRAARDHRRVCGTRMDARKKVPGNDYQEKWVRNMQSTTPKRRLLSTARTGNHAALRAHKHVRPAVRRKRRQLGGRHGDDE